MKPNPSTLTTKTLNPNSQLSRVFIFLPNQTPQTTQIKTFYPFPFFNLFFLLFPSNQTETKSLIKKIKNKNPSFQKKSKIPQNGSPITQAKTNTSIRFTTNLALIGTQKKKKKKKNNTLMKPKKIQESNQRRDRMNRDLGLTQYQNEAKAKTSETEKQVKGSETENGFFLFFVLSFYLLLLLLLF